jgi:deazaflavin-dependent oxidoreductase (nitroreductase family)
MAELRRYSEWRGRRVTLREALLEKFAMSKAGYQFLLHVAPRIDRVVIPRTNGRLSANGIDRVGLVTTTGAKSGEQRTQPLVLIDDGAGLLLIGSNYGRASHPAWSYNLLARPECDVVFRGPKQRYRAALLSGEERDKAWATAVDFYAGYANYKTSAAPREIRLFRLTPA